MQADAVADRLAALPLPFGIECGEPGPRRADRGEGLAARKLRIWPPWRLNGVAIASKNPFSVSI